MLSYLVPLAVISSAPLLSSASPLVPVSLPVSAGGDAGAALTITASGTVTVFQCPSATPSINPGGAIIFPSDFVSPPISNASSVASGAASVATGAAGGASSVLSSAASGAASVATGAASGASSVASGAVSGATGVASSALSGAASTATQALSSTETNLLSSLSQAQAAFGVIAPLLDQINTAINGFSGAFGGLPSQVTQLTGIISSVNSQLSSTLSSLRSLNSAANNISSLSSAADPQVYSQSLDLARTTTATANRMSSLAGSLPNGQSFSPWLSNLQSMQSQLRTFYNAVIPLTTSGAEQAALRAAWNAANDALNTCIVKIPSN